MSRSTCRQITLAKNGVAHVECCTECDCISLHIGSTTLRVDANGLEALWALLGEAASSLHARKQAEGPVGGLA